MAGEVVWTRLLALLFGATVYTFAIVLAVFLIGLGLGSAVVSTWAWTPARARAALAWCQVLSVVAMAWTAHALMASLPFWPGAASLSKDIWTNFRIDFLRAAWAVLPAPMLWGASVPLAIAAATAVSAGHVAGLGGDPARVVGRVYAANTVGAIAGALSTSLVLVVLIGSQHIQQLMMAVAACAAVLAEPAGRKDPPYVPIAALAAAAWLITTVPPLPGVLAAYGRNAAAWAGHAGDIFYVGEGMNSTVAVSRSTDGVLNYHNAGKIQASSQPQDMRLQRMLGHLTTLVPPNPRSVLVIGCGAGVTAGAVSVNPRVERVTIAEIEPLVPKVVSAHFSGANADVVRNPKTRIHIDDARHYLLTTRESFDAITSDPLDPWVKGAATLYTKEFFELARRHLNPGGVVTLFVQLYESSPEAVKSEVATFFDVFPNGVVWGNTFDGQAEDLVLMGSVEPLALDLDWMEWGWRQPEYAAVRRSLGEINIHSVIDLLGNYGGRASDLTPWLAGAAINRDRDLRLQYLAGLGLNLHVGRSIYAGMLRYRRFPADLFTGSEQRLWDLRQAIEGPRE
jgi:spermidine synthase